MSSSIECDHVFAILTRGPFPSGDATDQEVERHLELCESCREIAEALRPASDLFHESVSLFELNDLPRYGNPGDDLGARCRTMTEEAPASQRAPQSADRWPWLHALAMSRTAATLLWLTATVMVMAAVVGAATMQPPALTIPDQTDVVDQGQLQDLRQNKGQAHVLAQGHGQEWKQDAAGHLHAFNAQRFAIPDACRPAASSLATDDFLTSLRRQCCTHCHHASLHGDSLHEKPPEQGDAASGGLAGVAIRLKPASIGTIANACRLCHLAGDSP